MPKNSTALKPNGAALSSADSNKSPLNPSNYSTPSTPPFRSYEETRANLICLVDSALANIEIAQMRWWRVEERAEQIRWRNTFSFYLALDKAWIDLKINQFGIDVEELAEEVRYSGYPAEEILTNPNPLIYYLIYLIVNQLMNHEIVQVLSEELQDKLRDELYDSIYTNSLDSHLSAQYIFDNFKDRIESELLNLNSEDEVKTDQQLQKLEKLFTDYDF